MLPQINTGNTGFMVLCASLVMLMTPGLAFFYGGLVHRKNVLGIMIQSFVSMGWTTVLWCAFGYSMCFGPSVGGIIGDPFAHAFLRGIDLHTLYHGQRGPGHPHLRARGLPDDVRHHHPGPDHRRLRQPGDVQGLHAGSSPPG